MKRNFLLLGLAGAVAMALLGSASKAIAQCAAGTVGTQLNGNYAIKILGAQMDGGTPGDPTPAPIAGIGVFHADGACDITGGELIYNDNGTFTGPTTDPSPLTSITAFTGSLSANIDPASSFYFFNSNNQGVLVLSDSVSGNVFAFGIAMALGNAEFRGARINGTGQSGVDAVPALDAPPQSLTAILVTLSASWARSRRRLLWRSSLMLLRLISTASQAV